MTIHRPLALGLTAAAALGLLTACGGEVFKRQPTAAAAYEDAMRTPPRQTYPLPTPKTEGSLFTDAGVANLYTDFRARNVGDIVTINISETSKAQKALKTELGRQLDLSGGISSLLGFETEIPVNKGSVQPSALLAANTKSSFKGDTKTNRDESMKAQVSARVTQVLPNGYLVIRGSREITVNFEKQLIIIQGVVRPEDISPSNVVQSQNIADAVITYTGKGDLSDHQRKGWLARLLDIVWPF